MKIPVENLRSATEEEILGSELVKQDLDSQLQELTGKGSRSRGYVDLTGTPTPPYLDQNQAPLETGEPPVKRLHLYGKQPPPEGYYQTRPLAEQATALEPAVEAPATDLDLSQAQPNSQDLDVMTLVVRISVFLP